MPQQRENPHPGSATPSRKARSGEEGYILIAVLFLAVMVLIALSIAAPKMAASIERDREVELQHRGKQYVRAIKLYYKKFGAYPPTLEALEKSNEIRFLRRRYKDPITGKDEWHLIHFGEAKSPTAIGFFGQPLSGSTIAGIGPGGTAANAGGSIFGNSGIGASNGLTDNNAASSISNQGANGASNGSDPNSATTAAGTAGSGANAIPGGSIFGTSSSGNNQTFGGGGIIGVESTSPKQAILEYKKKKHFNEWEFVYDPIADQTTISNNTGIGQQIGTPGANGISTPGTFSNQPTNTNIPPQQQQQPLPPPTTTPQ